MDKRALQRFDPLYLNAHYYGAAATLRSYLGLPCDEVIPLGLAHGVDFGHVDPCQDINTIEPIHWAHNRRIAQAAAPRKPAIEIPHPFLLALRGKFRTAGGTGTLVVGPPPGPLNDSRLLALLDTARAADTTILVKPKRGYLQSIAFWKNHGFRTATLSDFGQLDYETMVGMLQRFDRVIGCTFSSLVVFAAAAGLRIELLTGFSYRCYDLVESDTSFEVINWDSAGARSTVRTFAGGDARQTTELALDILGDSLESSPPIVRKRLAEEVGILKEPVFWLREHGPITRWAGREAALALVRPGVLRFNPRRRIQALKKPRIWIRDMNEIAIWLEGKSPRTMSEEIARYQRGLTVPGDAVEPYPERGADVD